MARLLGTFLIAAAIGACSPTASIAPTMPGSMAPPAEQATFTVTGDGGVCGPWWFGCGAVLVVEVPGWTLPAGWAASADDTVFAASPIRKSDMVRFTGVWAAGRDRIEPGAYRLVVVLTSQSDSPPDATMSASVGCSADLEVPPGTGAVAVDVDFDQSPCAITVSMEPPTSAPS